MKMHVKHRTAAGLLGGADALVSAPRQPLQPRRGHDISLNALTSALQLLPQPAWLDMDDSAGPGFFNQAWEQFTGLALVDLQHTGWLSCLHPEDQRQAAEQWQAALSAQQAFRHDYRLLHHSGEYRWCTFQAQASFDAGAPRLLSCNDIHDQVLAQQMLAESVRMQTKMLDVSVDCIKIIRTDGSLSHMNKSGCEALGVAADSGFGMDWLNLLPPEIRTRGKRALRVARTGKNARFTGMSVIPGQKPQHWDNILTPMKASDGTTTGILCVSRDVTLQSEAERRLRAASDEDDLTGLPNRRAFKSYVKRTIAKSRQENRFFGLMLLDLDHFKHINDTLGHVAGDHLLRVLARRLQACLPAHSQLARLGGDEFALVMGHLNNEDELAQAAELVRQQIHAPISYAGKIINGGMSIGCALYPRDARDTSGLLKCADTALNDMKASGRGGVRMFNREMREATENAASQLERARQVVRDNLVIPYYQPKVHIATGKLIGFEALLRWHCPENGIQSPATLAEAFSDYELASKISDTIYNKVFADMATWLAQGISVPPISINAAPVEFLRDDFAERLIKRLNHFHIPRHLVEVEITEYVLGDRGSEYVARALQLLKKEGVRIALDDFGTGHSSFTDLRDYPVDCLKIDCSFVQRMTHEPAILAIVKAMCQLGADMNLDIVAEGIETQEQRAMLTAVGCRIGQGYLFGKAIPREEAERLLAVTAALPA